MTVRRSGELSGPRGAAAESLARGALDWLVGSARSTEAGLTWAATATGDKADHTLYHGGAGIVLALLEAERHFRDDGYGDAARRGAAAIAAAVDHEQTCSLYFGLSGMAVALHAVHTRLGDARAAVAARAALDRVRSRFDGQRWGAMFELLSGNAGIALGALHAGDAELALLAVEPYLRTADPTAAGINWAVRPSPPRSHHIAHGTLGIVYALAAVGAAAGRRDLTELALAGAADVVARDEAGPAGFLVPHSDPPHRPGLIERYSFGWCNGPAGDAQVFRLLGAVTGDPAWAALAARCWHTVTHCGLPRRIRPGFWDNNGRCCGTAGVLALACDRHAEQAQPLDFATVLAEDLAARATAGTGGVRWSNREHRATPSTLPPRNRVGDGQRRHHSRAASVRPRQHRRRSGLRRAVAGPSWRRIASVIRTPADGGGPHTPHAAATASAASSRVPAAGTPARSKSVT